MEQALEVSFGPRRTNVALVRAFAGIALLLAAVGVYAVTAFTVALRRREIAIRSALGAAASRNARDIIADATGPMVLGVLLGAAGTFAAAPALRAVLFQVDPVSPAPFAIVACTLMAAGLAAAVVGALPIRRIDPLDALRTE
jgi:ABC-type antimicrobial peptide transport system permease subunit